MGIYCIVIMSLLLGITKVFEVMGHMYVTDSKIALEKSFVCISHASFL